MKTLNIALQGGGSHGAFSWGALDRLLEDDRIRLEGVCACSAGAMNASALAYGLEIGGNQGAKDVLDRLWKSIHETGRAFSALQNSPIEKFWQSQLNSSFNHFMFDSTTRLMSPYQFNPLGINPLRKVLNDTVDFKVLKKTEKTKLFISATHVKTGKVKVFHNTDMCLDVVLASACLPFLFHAIEVQGEYYWDGGYMGNPSLYPLFYETDCRDIMIFHVNPLEREEIPKSASDIYNRINEISFNSSLIKDLRAIAFVKKLLEHDMLKPEFRSQFKNLYVHSIRADDAMCEYSVASKFDTNWEFLVELKEKGYHAMSQWLDKNFNSINNADTVDLHTAFLSSVNQMFK